jgi:predicted NBD/HSP70 family sugar kinase
VQAHPLADDAEGLFRTGIDEPMPGRADVEQQVAVLGHAVDEHADEQVRAPARRKGLADADTTIETIRTRSASGEPALAELLAGIGAILGRAMAGVVNLLGTPTIAVIGENHALWPNLEPGFSAAIRASPVTAGHHVTTIVRPWQDSQHARGAAALALAYPDTLS